MKPNPIFVFAWYLMKNYVSAKHIWPIEASVWKKARLALRALGFELSGRFKLRTLLGLGGSSKPTAKRPRQPRVVADQKPAHIRPGPIFQDPDRKAALPMVS